MFKEGEIMIKQMKMTVLSLSISLMIMTNVFAQDESCIVYSDSSSAFDDSDYLEMIEDTSLSAKLRCKALAAFLDSSQEWATPGNVFGFLSLPCKIKFEPVFDLESTNSPIKLSTSKVLLEYEFNTNSLVQVSFDLTGLPREVMMSNLYDSFGKRFVIGGARAVEKARKPLRVTGAFRAEPEAATKLMAYVNQELKKHSSLGDWMSIYFQRKASVRKSVDEHYSRSKDSKVRPILIDGFTADLSYVVLEMTDPVILYLGTWWKHDGSSWKRVDNPPSKLH
ncbi:hypothetical protein BVX97_02625 [bacterium E08(2017)]|nr:hypothetical protein BVX97_02625 [bacterium E08(2017)]